VEVLGAVMERHSRLRVEANQMGRTHYGLRDEIKDATDDFYKALSKRNLKLMEQVWAHVPYASAAGRGGELQQGWSSVRAYWEQRFLQYGDTEMKVRLTRLQCHAAGDIAWLSGVEVRTITTVDGTHEEQLRVTCVLQRDTSGWQLVSYHASLPHQPAGVSSPSS